MNYCRSCRCDFSSEAAYSRHRVGTHDFTFAQGLAMDPPREDGRRCMDVDELLAAGLELDSRARWRIALSETDVERFRSLRAAA